MSTPVSDALAINKEIVVHDLVPSSNGMRTTQTVGRVLRRDPSSGTTRNQCQEIEHGSWRGVIAGCYRLIAHAMVQRKHKI